MLHNWRAIVFVCFYVELSLIFFFTILFSFSVLSTIVNSVNALVSSVSCVFDQEMALEKQPNIKTQLISVCGILNFYPLLWIQLSKC